MSETPRVLIAHQPNHFLVISNHMLQNQKGEAQHPCVGDEGTDTSLQVVQSHEGMNRETGKP